jgi:hypothetical protein
VQQQQQQQQEQENHGEVMTGGLGVAQGIHANNDQYHGWYACSDYKSGYGQESHQKGRQVNEGGVAGSRHLQ